MSTRRNILTILGLAPVTTDALAADDFTHTLPGPGPKPGIALARYDPERLASALERLAAEVRAKTINVARFNISTDAVTDQQDWLIQTLTIDLEIGRDDVTLT